MSEAALKIVKPRRSVCAAQVIAPAALARGLAAISMDHHVIWDGNGYGARPGSRCSRVLGLIRDVWTPVLLRELVLRATRIEGDAGFPPEAVRDGLRQHQGAKGACYLLVRKTPRGDYVAVTDIPSPASSGGVLRPGDLVLSRRGRRFAE